MPPRSTRVSPCIGRTCARVTGSPTTPACSCS
jgi:hypothetical protein